MTNTKTSSEEISKLIAAIEEYKKLLINLGSKIKLLNEIGMAPKKSGWEDFLIFAKDISNKSIAEINDYIDEISPYITYLEDEIYEAQERNDIKAAGEYEAEIADHSSWYKESLI